MAEIIKHDDGGVTVELQYPVEHAGKRITSVTLRGRVKGADMLAMDQGKGQNDQALRLIAEMSGVAYAATLKMDSVDIAVIGGALGEIMLGNGFPQIGGTS
jgi:hypothetical protein